MAEATATGDGDIADRINQLLECSDRINQLLECSVCLERFKDPKSLPCQHTFCKTCLETLVVNDNNIPCPQCHVVHIISADGISELSTNFTIVSLMDIPPCLTDHGSNTSLKLSLKQTCPVCATETIQSDLTACPHCGDIICPVCSVSHFTEMKESLFKTSQHIHSDVGRMYDARNKLQAELCQLKQRSEDVKSDINKSMDRFIQEIREKQKCLCQQVDVDVNKASSPLESELECLQAELSSRLSLSASVDSAMAKILSNVESGIESLMSISAQCSDYNDQDSVNPSSSFQNRTNPNVNFVPINKQELSQSILKFGEIMTETRESNPSNSTEDIAMVTTARNIYHGRKGKVLIDEHHGDRFRQPWGIAVNPTGDRVYVTDCGNHTLQIFDACGRHIKTVHAPGGGVGGFNHPTGIAVNDDCDVIVADTDNHRIQVLNREGEYMFSFGEKGVNDGQLNSPRGLAVDKSYNIYVCDRENNRVQVYQRDGTFLRKFTRPGSVSGVFCPLYIAIAHDTHRVYIADYVNHRVHVYSTQGVYISCIGSHGSADGEMKHPAGICVDNEGHVILVDHGNHRVQVFNADGTFDCKLSSYGTEETQLSRPRDVTVDMNNRVFVTDWANYSVIVF